MGIRSNDVSITTDTSLSFDADGFMAGVSSYQPQGSNITRKNKNNDPSQLSVSRLQSSPQEEGQGQLQGRGQGQGNSERTIKLSPKRAKAALITAGVKAMSSPSPSIDSELKSTKTQQQLASMVMEVNPQQPPMMI